MNRKFISAVIVSVAAMSLSACAYGLNAPTAQQHASGNGRTATAGELVVQNATLVVDATDQTKATLLATFVNKAEADDQLGGATLPTGVTLGDAATVLDVPAKSTLQVGYNSEVSIPLTATEGALVPGHFVDVTLSFANAGPVKMSLLVNDNTGVYADVKIPTVAAAQ